MCSVYEMISKELAKYDEDIIKGEVLFAKETAQEIMEWRQNNPRPTPKQYNNKDDYRMACAIHAATPLNMAGTQGLYDVIGHGWSERREETIIKSAETKIAKRNTKIANKLKKAKITKVGASEIKRTNDGFEGYYKVDTETGTKDIVIRTIIAGGYNIQCLHLRVLVNIK